ncbi:efflux RND transporter permease subunit [Pseudohongiella spirulinae]|uniref:Cation/multidrug efflux pump n=1 Tax=Pseudohongiella spirulinae TaxID=1249552 RepID=A0A0S2KES2_9GAMM|nr:efflux RND transporter permease subunit [Pseudohongiella spirulinae]ALO46677.1 Cation/multidrug efflux pump [Pseudohongiella spirulinae]
MMKELPESSHKGLIAWFSANSVAANLLMFFILAAGIASVFFIKIQVFPDFETRTIQATMAYPGAAPEEVELAIVVPIEESVQGLTGISRLRSSAREGSGNVTMEVESGYDVTELLNEVKSRIDRISTFPNGVERPVVREIEMVQPVLQISVYGDLDDRALKTLTQSIRDDILLLSEVSQAQIQGDRDYEIAIEVSEHTLREYGLTLAQVAAAVRAGSIDVPGGAIRTENGRIQLRTQQQAYTGDEFGRIVLRTNPDGSRLLVRDIADVRDGFVETENFSRFDGNRALNIQVMVTPEQNVLDVERAVMRYIDDNKATFPSGVSIDAWGSNAFYLQGQLNMMLGNLIMGAALVFLVLTTFLRLNIALWVMVGIPVAFFGAIWLMPLGPFPVDINMISLFGLILVLGIVVDDAIITAESVHSEVSAEGHSLDNVVAGVKRVAVPATFGVLTTIAAFAPMLLVGGQVAPFFEAIGMVVILCLLFSLIESKLILPAHLAHSRIGLTSRAQRNWLERYQVWVAEGLDRFIQQIYRPTLSRALEYRYATVAGFIGALILSAGIIMGGVVRFEFFPNIPSDFIEARLTMNDGASFEARNAALTRMEQAILTMNDSIPDEDPVDHVVVFTNGDLGGSLVVELTKAEDREVSPTDIEQLWREKVGEIAGAREVRFFSSTSAGGGSPINLRLMGANYQQLEQAANDLVLKLEEYAGVFDVTNSYSQGGDEIKLRIKPQAEQLGLTASALGTQVRQAFFGEEAQRLLRGRDELRVMVRYPEDERRSIANLQDMRIRTADGTEVPFSDVADVTMGEGFSTISRIDRQRTVTVSADVNPLVAQSGTIIRDVISNYVPELLARYPEVNFGLGGASEEQAELIQRIALFFMAAMFLIFTLLAIPLKSYLQPLIVMSVIPFGIIGAVIGHIVFDVTVSMMSLFGLVALAGVIVNDSLIMVDFVNRGRRTGLSIVQAVLDAGTSRFRAILLTTLTTFFGLLPIMFETSMQAQLVKPMTLSLAFGIAFGTVLTLFLIPCLYLMLDDLVRVFRGERSVQVATEEMTKMT